MRVEEIVAEKDGFGKWIPCSERLPENDTNVIACFSHGLVTELRYVGNGIFEGIYESLSLNKVSDKLKEAIFHN